MSPIRQGSVAGALLGVSLSGCSTGKPMSMFGTGGPYAGRISSLTWFMIALAAAVFVAVIVTLWMGARRRRGESASDVDQSDPGTKFVVIGGAILPALVLLAVFIAAMSVTGVFPPKARGDDLAIKVTGHQWWWGIDYKDPDSQREFSTANEMHIPVGRTVRVTLVSADVIHSFWVPQLQGKIDVIPGDTNEVRLFASKAGDYRGQCAEFCGAQHAHMAMHVIAEEPAAYQAWVESQRQPAPPTDSLATAGQQIFATQACAVCHTVRGTDALGMVGPDLTHVGSRTTIAAGTLANTEGNLVAWIANAPLLKPGTRMPAMPQLNADQVRALASYLRSLR